MFANNPALAQSASEQTIALLAADNLHPSREGLTLLKSMDVGDTTYEQAMVKNGFSPLSLSNSVDNSGTTL